MTDLKPCFQFADKYYQRISRTNSTFYNKHDNREYATRLKTFSSYQTFLRTKMCNNGVAALPYPKNEHKFNPFPIEYRVLRMIT